ncbi:P-loop containing nucleoside triphosphate hydrolase protein [Roridomyces roridus]|uniref:P-loop containing nucleoside triphosphate hydrolase protein n=1 Tax=Roridomyces roridus TaxID=1738132 RepID=A0AAD7F9U9_9AGAR|nr:P-loop containing nucleoside triphosphate hydrolase protein [Roridomyces roridus]
MQQYFSQEPRKRRIFVLHGLGGSGKTQVALKFLEETADEFTMQFFVNASSPEAINNSFMNIAISQSFGKTPEAGLQWLISEHKEWTLLFDNADDPKLKLSTFFPRCTHGKIIITSRNPQLAVYGPASHSQVGDLDEENAALLLLARALREDTEKNHKLAMDIVQELSCLPLAIVQAGAYIAKFKCLKNYLSLYRQNKKELLLQHPDQSLDDYEWTVYTTWQISFEKLSPVAARFLQLCALLHHSSIPESIFANATKWILSNEGNETDSMREAREFLGNFVSGSGNWSEQYFRNIVAEIEEYSLLQSDETSSTLSMHPLVHLWCSGNLPDQVTTQACMANVLGMAIDLGPDAYLERIGVIAHVNMLVPDFTVLNYEFWRQYAWIYYVGGQFEQAKGLYEMDLERQKELFGKDHPDTLSAMGGLAAAYGRLGRYQEAEGLKLSVLQGCQKLLGDDHPDTLFAMAHLAATYRQLGRYQEAEGLGLSVLQGRQKLLGNDHPDTLFAMANLAATYWGLGRYQEAEGLGLSVLQGRQKLLGDDHPDTLNAMANLAATYERLGRYQEAEGLELSVLQGRQKLLGNDHPDILFAMANLADTYRGLGRYQEAEGLDFQVSVFQGHQNL